MRWDTNNEGDIKMEDLNNVVDTNATENEEVDLFADDDAGDTNLTETSEEETKQTTEQTTEETTEETKEEEQQQDNKSLVDKIPVKFLGNDLEVTKDKAIPLIQKGLDYDHKVSEITKLRAENEELKSANTFKANEAKVAEMVADGYTEEFAREHIRLLQVEADSKTTTGNSEKTAEDTRKANMDEFIAEFPDVYPKDWPEPVRVAYLKGESIVNLYRKEEMARIKSENSALKKNNANKEKAVGAIETTKAAKKDSFLEGLLS